MVHKENVQMEVPGDDYIYYIWCSILTVDGRNVVHIENVQMEVPGGGYIYYIWCSGRF